MTNFTPLRSIAFAALLNLVLFSLPVHGQETDTPTKQPKYESVPAEALELAHYRVANTSARDLAKVAERLFGRRFLVQKDGSVTGSPVDNIEVLGNAILVFDEATRVNQLMERLAVLDGASEVHPVDMKLLPEQYETVNWSPSYVSLRDAYSALQSYQRALPNASNVRNLTTVDERNVLIMRDQAENLESMRAVLAKLDTPAPELNVSAMVVQGRTTAPDGSTPPLPAELSAHLRQLLPFEHFEMLSMGLVRTSTRVSNVQVSMPAEDNVSYELSLRPEAFDAEAGTLTSEVRFQGSDRRSIQTRTQIPLNEYTVIGASGSTPLLVIIKLLPVGGLAH